VRVTLSDDGKLILFKIEIAFDSVSGAFVGDGVLRFDGMFIGDSMAAGRLEFFGVADELFVGGEFFPLCCDEGGELNIDCMKLA
jgi:hypothetical protein